MITVGLIAAVIALISEGEWGPAAVCVVLLLFGFALISAAGEDARAYNNRQHYWAMSEVERERERRRARAVVDREEQIARERAREQWRLQEEKQFQKALAVQREQEAVFEEGKTPVFCAGCRRQAREINRIIYPSGAEFIYYQCPYCGERKLKKAA